MNFVARVAHGGWDRRSFLRHWHKVYGDDSRAAPPHHTALSTLRKYERNPYLAGLSPMLFSLEALRRPRRPTRREGGLAASQGPTFSSSIMEEPVAAAVLMVDRRRQPTAGYLGLLRCVNDEETLERFIGEVQEILWQEGCRTLLGPTGLSPHLQTGILQNHFNQTPPLHTAYNPPYLPELMDGVLQPLAESQLYYMDLNGIDARAADRGPAEIRPLRWPEQRGDLEHLLSQTLSHARFPTPDSVEAGYILDHLAAWPLSGWLALLDGRVVGYVLLQPDLAGAALRSGGGRNPMWRPWLSWRIRRPVHAGTVPFGGVLTDYRGRGIGLQLWSAACTLARQSGWSRLHVGPVPKTAAQTQEFLQNRGAKPQQRYVLYGQEF